jgi:hypothetical protein
MADVPLDETHNVTTAEMDTSDTLGAFRKSSNVVPMKFIRLAGSLELSNKLSTSAGMNKLTMATNNEKNGTMEMMTKKEACAAYTVIRSSEIRSTSCVMIRIGVSYVFFSLFQSVFSIAWPPFRHSEKQWIYIFHYSVFCRKSQATVPDEKRMARMMCGPFRKTNVENQPAASSEE